MTLQHQLALGALSGSPAGGIPSIQRFYSSSLSGLGVYALENWSEGGSDDGTSSGYDDGAGSYYDPATNTLTEETTVVGVAPTAGSPFDFGAAAQGIASWLGSAFAAGSAGSQQAALLAAQRARAERESNMGLIIAGAVAVLAVGGAIYAAVK